MITSQDIAFMRQAMELAAKGEGAVNPNPLVGALIVHQGNVIASGYHERYGDLHAERNAFRQADTLGKDCHGATMYVTLEPCCHHGHQPPCTDAVMAHGISRLVVGLMDPNPLVAGKGLEILKNAGIQVEMIHETPEGCELEDELRYQNRVFLKYITTGMPWVMAKWAMTLDGKTATRVGDSKWVSGEESRRYVHGLRKTLKGILCGIGTVLADDPMLNCRLEGNPRQPVRMVADRRLRIPLDSQLVKTARDYRTVVVYGLGVDDSEYAEGSEAHEKLELLNQTGVECWHCRTLTDFLQKVAKEKIDGILLEGGGTLNDAFLQEGLIDEVATFIAPKIIGGAKAKTPVDGNGFLLMSEAVQLAHVTLKQLGNDILIHGLVQK